MFRLKPAPSLVDLAQLSKDKPNVCRMSDPAVCRQKAASTAGSGELAHHWVGPAFALV